MLHNLKKALKNEWTKESPWRSWFEPRARAEVDDVSYISSAAGMVLEQSPRGGQQLLWAIAAFFIVMLVWAGLAEIDEFTRGEGKVIPSRHVQVVQNLEGGILAELYVQEGQQVKQGQPLLRIDDTQFSSSLREADVTLDQLRARLARLEAEAGGQPFVTTGLPDIDAGVLQEEQALYTARQRELASRNQVLQEQVIQKNQELSELQAKRNQVARSLELLQKELEMTRPLAEEGAISRVELLRLEREVNDLRGSLESTELSIPRARSALEEARQKLSNAELLFQAEARKEQSDVKAELARLLETSGALEDRVKRTLVTSPVAGSVKQMLLKTIGGVIQPGMDIVEIVPTEDKLLVEARVRPADIAFLHPGQKAMVKVTAYDFSIHGGLQGSVVHISPDTILDEHDESFYLVRIETDRTFLGSEERPLPIIAGMTVSVDILTGKKTVLDYILKPIFKTRQLALRER
ncbi:HlyD family type I secretion periplasmic adaptor subunit [Pseudomaricurvus sp. HS19]|uniref:HlyD family type I secretion periplasmic adaptor subunit n=1 Tax=Pseudomaricurvus sp. HS19 TaxID=2692626 RepID=UPI00351A11FD